MIGESSWKRTMEMPAEAASPTVEAEEAERMCAPEGVVRDGLFPPPSVASAAGEEAAAGGVEDGVPTVAAGLLGVKTTSEQPPRTPSDMSAARSA